MIDFTKYTELIAQYLAGEISLEHREQLMSWVEANAENKAFFEETVELWKVSANYNEPFETDLTNAWNQLESQLDTFEKKDSSSPKIIHLSKFKQLWRVAAVFLIGVAGLYFIFQDNQKIDLQLVEYQTFDEEKKKITLPDNSTVWLNENSRLTFQKKFGRRMVTLEGEAWFDVQHLEEQPFEIESGEARTVVLGTAFNVRAYPQEDRIEVTVERGKVAFSNKENIKDTTFLPAGTEGVFYKKEKKIEKDTLKVNNANAWQTEELVFDNTSLEEVIETLERYFEVEIEVTNPDILNCFYKNKFSNPSLDYVMEIITATFPFESEHQDDVWILSGEGCEPQVIN